MTTRIGVVADTHCPEFLDRLPDRLFEVLRGVDLVIHAGDVNSPQTIAALETIAPVAMVRGDHDHEPGWPLSREVTVEGKRIVVVHGNRSRWVEEPQTFLWTVSLGAYHPHGGLARVLRTRFGNHPDAIVFGHTHRPLAEMLDGTLMFNPGGVHQWNPQTASLRLSQTPGWFEWSWLQVARHIRDHAPPSVGILDVSPSTIVPMVIRL